MKPKDIFGLAVRLLGLYFLYLGLKAVMPMLDLELIENPDKNDIINLLMPVVFNLAVAWWFLRGGLTRFAYPESKTREAAASLPERRESAAPATASPSTSTQLPSSAQLTGMEQAEKKLAALVDKPGDGRAAWSFMDNSTALKQEIKRLMVENLMLQVGPDDIADAQPLFGPGSVGLDSVDALQLVVALDKAYGLKIADSDGAKRILHSVDTMAAAVATHQKSQ